MSNCYQRVTASDAISCSEELYAELKQALEVAAEEQLSAAEPEDSGFDWDYFRGYLYGYAEDWGNPDAIPEGVLAVLGKIISAATLPHWEFSAAYWDDKCRPESAGGFKFRIMADGSLVYAKTAWEGESE